MSYNILNKGVKFQGDTQGTIEDIVDTHSTQTINGLKTITHLTGTNVRITNDLTASGNISASVNISAAAFYGNGSTLSNVGKITAVTNGADNRMVTFTSADALNGEALLTFNGTTKVLTVGGSETPDQFVSISGSGNISGSAFYGDGANLSNVAAASVALASNGGLANSSGVLVDPTAATEETSAATGHFLLIHNGTGLRKITCGRVANLFDPVVETFTNQTQHRVVTVEGANAIDGEANLTFDGSILTITGDVSGSQVISGSIGHFVTTVEAGAISLGNSAGIAGAGLGDNSGQLDVMVSGAVMVSSDKVGLTGSLAGYGLAYEGGVNSISSLKLDFGSLTDAAINRSNDFITFVDADDGEAKRDSVVDFVGFIAGSGLDASSGQLSVDVSDFMTSGSNNRIITATGTDGMTAESDVNFNSSTGVFSVRGEVHVINEAGAAGSLTVSETGSMSYLIVSGSSMTSRAIIQAPNSVPADSLLHSGSFSFFLDEGNNKLKVRVKYGDGTMKDGEISLT